MGGRTNTRQPSCYTQCLDSLVIICYTQTMAKMGRPKMLAKERSSHLIALRLTDAEYKVLKQAAGSLSLSDYVRSKLNLRGGK